MDNLIGLKQDYSENMCAKLNDLLASYHVFYMNIRGFHWNIKGELFFPLHEKFEELYTEVAAQIDEIAERILTLGSTPRHSYVDFMQHSKVEPHKNVTDGKACAVQINVGFTSLLELQRDILKEAAESGDEGTAAQISEYISIQEKHMWMYNAVLG